MNNFDRLVEMFVKFPGIGPRQARRFAYYLASSNKSYIADLTRIISTLNESTKHCTDCRRLFSNGQGDLCDICANPNTKTDTLMLVTRDIDLESVKKSDYPGRFFVLGSLVPLLDSEPSGRVNLPALLSLIDKLTDLKEIIMALPASPLGDNTADYLVSELREPCESRGIKISLLGRGISTGTDLEYLDPDTLRHALDNRR